MTNRPLLFLIALFFGVLPLFSWANGGDQRVVEGTYLINLSRAPFTPRVGVKTAMLASFVDLEENKLISEDLTVHVRIAKLGGGDGKREFLFERDSLAVKGGVLELAYTFTETGLHEVFFDFSFARSPETIYQAPDFLIDVQPPAVKEPTPAPPLLWFVVGTIVGALSMWALYKRH